MATPLGARDLVGFGRNRPQFCWPGNAKLAVSIVLNYEAGAEQSVADGDPLSESLPGVPQPAPGARDVRNESLFEFGSRVGVWRLMDIFDEYRVPITCFACGRALERNPDFGAALAERGHETAGHGYRWVRYRSLTRSEQLEDIRRAVAAIERTTGERPVGWFARDYAPETRELLVEVGGFLYDSHAFNDEVPYFTDVNGTRFLVVPYAADTNDFSMTGQPTFSRAGDFCAYLCAAFTRLHGESQRYPRMMTVALHERVAGLAGRANDVVGFLEFAQSFRDVWFARRRDIAQHWLDVSS